MAKVCGVENEKKWLESRKTGIGASEAATACGVSPWATPLELYHQKRGEIPAFAGNDATRWGQFLEPGILGLFSEETGIPILEYSPGLFRHDAHRFMLATPDAFTDGNAGIECKATTSRTEMGDSGTADAPISWAIQAQQQIAVCELDRVYIAVGVLDMRQIVWFDIQRDDELIASMVTAERELWQRIETGEPPEPDWDHSSTADMMRKRYPDFDESERVKLSTNAQLAWEQAERLQERIKRMETQRKILQGHAIKELEKAQYGVFPDGERMLRKKTIAASESVVKRKERSDIRCVKVPKKKAKRTAR